SLIDDQSRTHGGAQGHTLDVNTFGSGRLQTLEVGQQRLNVLLELNSLNTNLANGAVDDAVLVSTEAHQTSHAIIHSSLNDRRHGANLRVRHQTTRTEDLAQLTNNAHRIGGSDNHVIVQVAAFHFGSQIVHTNAISAGSQSCFSSRALGKYCYAHSLAS